MGLEISRRGVQFLAPESLCSPSYEGLKVHVPHSTITVRQKTVAIAIPDDGSPLRTLTGMGRMNMTDLSPKSKSHCVEC